MIHTTIDILGTLALTIITGFLILFIYHILLTFSKAWSWHRWALKISKTYDTKVVWKHIPKSFLILWWDMLADCTASYHSDKGRWDGVGKWVVYPKVDTPKSEVKNMWEEE